MVKVPRAVDSGEVRQAIEKQYDTETADAVLAVYYGNATPAQHSRADGFMNGGEFRQVLSRSSRIETKEVDRLVDSYSKRSDKISKMYEKKFSAAVADDAKWVHEGLKKDVKTYHSKKLGQVTVPEDEDDAELKFRKTKGNEFEAVGADQINYIIKKDDDGQWVEVAYDSFENQILGPIKSFKTKQEAINYSHEENRMRRQMIGDDVETTAADVEERNSFDEEQEAEHLRDLRFDVEKRLADDLELGDEEPEYEDVVDALREEEGLSEKEIDLAFSIKQKKKKSAKKGGAKVPKKARSKTSGWSKLKQELPSSGAVKARIRDGGHSEAYTKVLKSLQKYWEKRSR